MSEPVPMGHSFRAGRYFSQACKASKFHDNITKAKSGFKYSRPSNLSLNRTGSY